MKRTELCLKDVYNQSNRCLCKSYILRKNEIGKMKNWRPIGLSFMVIRKLCLEFKN